MIEGFLDIPGIYWGLTGADHLKKGVLVLHRIIFIKY